MFDFLRSSGRTRNTPPMAMRLDPPALPALPASTGEPRTQSAMESERITVAVMQRRTPGKHHSVGVRFLDAGKTGRLETSWTTTPLSASAIIRRDWRTVVARSRDAAENNDHARKFLSMVRENVAGPRGFRFKADPVDILNDGTESRDTFAADAIDRAFEEWSRAEHFDAAGKLSRRDFERLAVAGMATDGEVLAMFVYGDDAGPYGFAIQHLDPLVLRPDHNEELPSGLIIRHGIEMTKAGRPVAYHLAEFEPQFGGASVHYSAKIRRVPAEFIIHAFLPELPNQSRGLGWMRTVLPRLRNIKGYEDAAVINARIGAAKMGFFTDPEASADDDDDIAMDAEPGVFENIGNRTFSSFNPQFPTGDFEPFLRGTLRSVAAGLLVSYNNLSADLTSVNYSSIRQGALDERDVWMGLQEHVIEHICTRIYERWLEYALLARKITTVSGRALPPDKIAKYRRVMFNGRRWTWIDPLKEIAAAERAVTLGIKSRQSIVRETSADDPWRTWAEIAEEKAQMESLGIYTPPAGTAPSGSPNGNATTGVDTTGDGIADS